VATARRLRDAITAEFCEDRTFIDVASIAISSRNR